MKVAKAFLLLNSLFFFGVATAQISIQQMEYFIDIDPGIGMATPISITSSESNITVSDILSTENLPSGFHRIFIRIQDSNGVWSMPLGQSFYKYATQTPVTAAQIQKMEYFIDTDPGLGLGNPITVVSPDSAISLTPILSTENIPSGFHRAYVRAQDSNGKWSMILGQSFYKYAERVVVAPKIVEAEYFIGTDPGLGAATTITIPSAADSVTLQEVVSITQLGLDTGEYTINVRLRDSEGVWSIPKSRSFLVSNSEEPFAGFDIVQNLNTVTITDESFNADTYFWDFGDGITDETASPIHTYQSVGNYTITQIVSNEIGSDTSEQVVEINSIALDPPGNLSASNISSSSFTLSWGQVSGATNYLLDVSESESFVSYIEQDRSINSTSFNVTGLLPSTSYFVRLRATSSNGTSDYSNSLQVTTFNESQVAIAITDSTFSSLSSPTESLVVSVELNAIENVDRVILLSKNLRTGASQVISTSQDNTIFEATVPSSSYDGLGLSYQFFVLNTNNDTLSRSSLQYAYFDIANGYDLTGLNNGKEVNDYQILSFPLQLESNRVQDVVVDELGGVDKTKWRMFQYQNNTTSELSVNSSITRGKGYWLIKTQTGNLNTGAGITELPNNEPYTINLTQGWNLIGNPYAFDISWEDVRKFNGICATDLSDSLKVFEQGFVKNAATLKAFRGAFVYATAPQQLRFPYTSNIADPAGCRVAARLQANQPLEADAWLVPFQLEAGGLGYKLGGIGMHPLASNGTDVMDEPAMPRFLDYVDMEFDGHSRSVTRDIVTKAGQHTWSFSVETSMIGETVALSWDNSYFGENNKELLMVDETTQNIIDMRIQNSYEFTGKASNSFKVYFGDKDKLYNKVLPNNVSMGQPYPNPAKIGFTVPFTLPKTMGEKYQVRLSIYDIMGKEVVKLISEKLEAGYHEMPVQSEVLNGQGMYVIILTVNTPTSEQYTFKKKLIMR